MKVAFDSRPASEPSGVGRYTRCLLKALRETAPAGAELAETQRPGSLGRSRGADVFHAPWMDGAMLHSPCAMVVTVHNLSALKRRSEQLRAGGVKLRLRKLAVQRAARVIVPTEAVAHDAAAYLRIDDDRVSVIPEAADAAMYPRSAAEVAAARSRHRLPERYLMWVGCLEHPEPGRHLAKLAATARELPLVLVGPTRPWAHELPNVILTGRVGDDDLAAIYSGAHALVLPSEDEGFGLPAIEALACGAPVVACASPALREVLDGRASLVAPNDMKALLAAAEAARRPAPAAPPWSWQDAARATWHAYERAAAFAARQAGAAPRRRRPAQAPRLDGLEPR